MFWSWLRLSQYATATTQAMSHVLVVIDDGFCHKSVATCAQYCPAQWSYVRAGNEEYWRVSSLPIYWDHLSHDFIGTICPTTGISDKFLIFDIVDIMNHESSTTSCRIPIFFPLVHIV